MANYLIELPHTAEECLQALTEISEKGSELLPKVYWGCKAGVHNGWAIVEAENESTARSMIASQLVRGKASVVEVTKVTQEDIEAYHR